MRASAFFPLSPGGSFFFFFTSLPILCVIYICRLIFLALSFLAKFAFRASCISVIYVCAPFLEHCILTKLLPVHEGGKTSIPCTSRTMSLVFFFFSRARSYRGGSSRKLFFCAVYGTCEPEKSLLYILKLISFLANDCFSFDLNKEILLMNDA